MSENLFTAVLTFSLLAGGTAAVGTEMFNTRQAPEAPATVLAQGMVDMPTASSMQVVVLPAVTVTGRRDAQATQVVVLPAVTITGRRDAPVRVALAGSSNEAARVQ